VGIWEDEGVDVIDWIVDYVGKSAVNVWLVGADGIGVLGSAGIDIDLEVCEVLCGPFSFNEEAWVDWGTEPIGGIHSVELS
jgi:hypothetical protein